MENSRNCLVLHPQMLEVLFAHKSKVSNVFRDVLGIHEINHISITRISRDNKLLVLSSTPALEFNLFNGSLWHYDQSYSPHWYHQKTQAYWQTLYSQTRYDELYYLKQIKHGLPLGISLAAQIDDTFVIYSLASKKNCAATQELFATRQEDFYKIGQYCSNILSSTFNSYDSLASTPLSRQAHYEPSK
jgi:hypothetical protein